LLLLLAVCRTPSPACLLAVSLLLAVCCPSPACHARPLNHLCSLPVRCLQVVASSLDTLDAVVLDRFSDKADLAACLKASANVPQIAGGPQLVRGQRLVDAGTALVQVCVAVLHSCAAWLAAWLHGHSACLPQTSCPLFVA
jgi:hypothetical protein